MVEFAKGENMPTIEEALAERTYKQDGLDVEKRIFYTLHGDEKSPKHDESQNHRNSKAISLLFKLLLEKRLLTEEQLDEILLEVTH
jgi:lactam utilization protein B